MVETWAWHLLIFTIVNMPIDNQYQAYEHTKFQS